jgi:hypothetical protein
VTLKSLSRFDFGLISISIFIHADGYRLIDRRLTR